MVSLQIAGEEVLILEANWDKSELNKDDQKIKFVALVIRTYFFIKLKQVLNYEVHNLGKTSCRFLFL